MESFILTRDEIKQLIDFFWQNEDQHHHTNGMQKLFVSPNWDQGLKDILGKYVSKTPIGDNFYRHVNPYLPHSDFHNQESYNVVIPLEVAHEQKFIVFDQKMISEGRTWTGNYDFKFESNSSISEPFYKCGIVEGLTNREIDQDLYKHIPHFDKDFYFGMSGTVYDWVPGHTIVFDSRHIHMTGKMSSEKYKLGLTLRIPKN